MKLHTMERALGRYPNRFELTMLAASRAKELNTGETPVCGDLISGKPVVLALQEIAEDKVIPATLEEMEKIREASRLAREKALMALREEEAAREAAREAEQGSEASEEIDPET